MYYFGYKFIKADVKHCMVGKNMWNSKVQENRHLNFKTACLLPKDYWVNRDLQTICKSLNRQPENQSILSFLCSQFWCKTAPGRRPTAPSWRPLTLLEGHLALLARWTSPWGSRVRLWLRLWLSVCKVTAASLVTPTASSGTEAVFPAMPSGRRQTIPTSLWWQIRRGVSLSSSHHAVMPTEGAILCQ